MSSEHSEEEDEPRVSLRNKPEWDRLRKKLHVNIPSDNDDDEGVEPEEGDAIMEIMDEGFEDVAGPIQEASGKKTRKKGVGNVEKGELRKVEGMRVHVMVFTDFVANLFDPTKIFFDE